MASNTKILETKRKNKRTKGGRKRKNASSKRSTLSYAELFAPIDNPNSQKK